MPFKARYLFSQEGVLRIASSTSLFCLLVYCTLSCTPKDNERCRSGFYFDGWNCMKTKSTDSDTGTLDTMDSGLDDAGLLEGLYEPCTKNGPECDGYKRANYCVFDPFTQTGLCTIPNCTRSPDNCPEGYECCDLPDLAGDYPNMCFTPEHIQTIMGMASSCDG